MPAEVSDLLRFSDPHFTAFGLRIDAQFRDWKAHKAECKSFKWVQQREQVREEARKQLPEDLQSLSR